MNCRMSDAEAVLEYSCGERERKYWITCQGRDQRTPLVNEHLRSRVREEVETRRKLKEAKEL